MSEASASYSACTFLKLVRLSSYFIGNKTIKLNSPLKHAIPIITKDFLLCSSTDAPLAEAAIRAYTITLIIVTSYAQKIKNPFEFTAGRGKVSSAARPIEQGIVAMKFPAAKVLIIAINAFYSSTKIANIMVLTVNKKKKLKFKKRSKHA